MNKIFALIGLFFLQIMVTFAGFSKPVTAPITSGSWPAEALPPSPPSMLRLANGQIRVEWRHTSAGWKISSVQLHINGEWQETGNPSGEYTLLYVKEQPDSTPQEHFRTVSNTAFPDPVYKYQIKTWEQSISPVSLNTAGQALQYYPAEGRAMADGSLVFTQETEVATITTEWRLDPAWPSDILVRQKLVPKTAGYFSLASPSLFTLEEKDLTWATVPGYFQGSEIQPNFVLAYAYGQGIPGKPVVFRERCASSLSPVISTRQGFSVAVIPDPGLGRDPWAKDHSTQRDWQIGLSHMNRRSQLSPTVYFPVLGEPASALLPGKPISYGFRFSLQQGDWYKLLHHTINDIYHFKEALALRTNRQSLSRRRERMLTYLSDTRTAMWNIEEYKGMKIGAQSYLGGVVGSQGDAMKNSDYGAMWMAAAITGNGWFRDSILPYALNFKLVQQQTDPGFFQGAATGQYYLAKTKKFVEEWGEFVEPISLTYYTMLDIGNILLFEPGNDSLRARLHLGAESLLKWQKPDGSWDVAYDRQTEQPIFTDLQDLRPTFYGLLVAYRILGTAKYLDAARKGADWFIHNGIDKGHFIGVCGDARYIPDFATAQSAQALLDLYDLTKDPLYKQAAIRAGRIYTASIYTQPVASRNMKTVKGVQREDWEISQSGLSFEHGGILGSANGAGPIALCSHAGLFIRLFGLTGDSLFAEMARAAAIGRDAFVDSATSVASYYWNAMNKGAGPYPHHAWWQIGWITDYLMAEAQLRSEGKIVFPRGFVTPKVGPHQSYGFAPGTILDEPADLLLREGLVRQGDPNIEVLTAMARDKKRLFIILLNDRKQELTTELSLDMTKLAGGKNYRVRDVRMTLNDRGKGQAGKPAASPDRPVHPGKVPGSYTVTLGAYGISVLAVDYEE